MCSSENDEYEVLNPKTKTHNNYLNQYIMTANKDFYQI